MRQGRAPASAWWMWALLALNAVWATDLFVLGGGFGAIAAPGALLTALGRLTGLYGALALLLQLVLIARIPPLESALGLAPSGHDGG